MHVGCCVLPKCVQCIHAMHSTSDAWRLLLHGAGTCPRQWLQLLLSCSTPCGGQGPSRHSQVGTHARPLCHFMQNIHAPMHGRTQYFYGWSSLLIHSTGPCSVEVTSFMLAGERPMVDLACTRSVCASIKFWHLKGYGSIAMLLVAAACRTCARTFDRFVACRLWL